MELTKEEMAFLHHLLDQAVVTGIAPKMMIIRIMAKLEQELQPGPQGPKEEGDHLGGKNEPES